MTDEIEYPTLISPVNIAGLDLDNRIVMPPMATAMEPGSDQYRAWFEARAAGGVGIIITGAHSVGQLQDQQFAESLADTVEAAHEHGVPIVQQIIQRPPHDPDSHEPMGPGDPTEQRMAQIPADFARAADRCKAIGFDGVEPHGAHGFFLNQVFSRNDNQRTDKYGGDLEGRMRLAVEIITAVREAVGDDYPIFYRHTLQQEDGYSADESVTLLGELLSAGLDVIDISPSTADRVDTTDSEADAEPEHCNLAKFVKDRLTAPVIAVGGMEHPVAAEAALREGKCDLCAVGRQLIADADWPNKIAEGRIDDIIECVKCDEKCFGNLSKGIPIGCTQNPRSGNEYKDNPV